MGVTDALLVEMDKGRQGTSGICSIIHYEGASISERIYWNSLRSIDLEAFGVSLLNGQ